MIALVFGAGGQQGFFMLRLLVERGYECHGAIRSREILAYQDGVRFHICDMTDDRQVKKLIHDILPDEIYNLAAMNNIDFSFEHPNTTLNINCGGQIRIMEAVREIKKDCRIYFAASSEVFGDPVESPQSETTPFNPRNPYGVSKVAALQISRVYREKHGMKICCGILYNNESTRRPDCFLIRKVCKHVASVINGNQEKLKLGNLEARRDFGYAPEYCYWTYLIMQHEIPDDFIMATGVTHSVEDVVKIAFGCVGKPRWGKFIDLYESLYRPAESKELVGDIAKSKTLLGFEPNTTLKELIKIMVQHELDQYKN